MNNQTRILENNSRTFDRHYTCLASDIFSCMFTTKKRVRNQEFHFTVQKIVTSHHMKKNGDIGRNAYTYGKIGKSKSDG